MEETAVKQKYTITMDNQIGDVYSLIVEHLSIEELAKRGYVEIVWSANTTESKAREMFGNYISKQVHEYHVLKTIKKWRVIRLFDENNKQIVHEG